MVIAPHPKKRIRWGGGDALVERHRLQVEAGVDGPQQPHHLLRQLDPRREEPPPEPLGALLEAVAGAPHFFAAYATL